MKLSVIIPIGFKEKQLGCLLQELKDLPRESEVLLLSSDKKNFDYIENKGGHPIIRKILSPKGRAQSMNKGTKESKGKFLWFLHADSKLDRDTISSLIRAINQKPNHFFYFNLAFYDGPKLMKLNEWGVRFRTYFLKTPFGDQGFCLKKDIFNRLGGYKEGLAYGEDHLLVRQARRKNVPVTRIKSKIYTSGRKYEINGWLKTTLMHLYLTLKQVHTDNKKHRRNQI